MLKKIFLGFLALFILVIAAAVVLPIIYKDKIVQLVKNEANNNLNATLNFGAFDVSIISTFPDFNFSIQDLSIAGINEFKRDTLIAVKNLSLELDLMTVIQGTEIRIKSIQLEQPRIHAIVLKNGKANWDIAKPDTAPAQESEPSKFNIKLNSFSIEGGYVLYEDATFPMETEIVNLNHTLEGDFTQDLFTLLTKTTMDELSLSYGGVKYLNKAKTSLKADLEMDMVNSKYTFKENELGLNDLHLGLDGWLAMPGNDINMDLKYAVKESDFKNFISLVPGVYTEGFADAKSTGKLGFDGFVKGLYNDQKMPGFGLNLQIENGSLKYPALPSALNNVQVNLKISNPDGKPDHTLINLAKMHVELGKEPFDMKLLVKTPVSDPQIDAAIKGKINLGNLATMIPLEKNVKLSGLIQADLTAKGRMSSIESGKYEAFDASGNLSVTGLTYTDGTPQPPVNISALQMAFNPRNVTLSRCDIKIGKSDMSMSGTLDNFIAYALDDQTLKGTLNFNSNTLDIDQLMGPETAEAAPADTAPPTVFEVPGNIDFALQAKIGKLIYDKSLYSNVSGGVVLKGSTVSMENLTMYMLDGKMICSGSYSTLNPRKPTIHFDLDISNFDIQKTVKTYNSVKSMAPAAEKCFGKYSAKFTLKGSLDEKMDPVYETLNGGGKLMTHSMTLKGFTPIEKVADAVKMPQYKTMDLSNTDISFKFSKGRVFVEPFTTKIGTSKATMGGSNGFDQSIDYTMEIEMPRAQMGSAANSAVNGLIAEANKKGAKFSADDQVRVKVKIGGTITEPVIKTGLGDAVAGAKDDLKAKAQEELEKKKAEAEERARAEADKLKNEAEEKARAEADKVKKQADEAVQKAKKEAEAKAKAEADKAKKAAEEKAKKEAQKGLKNLIK